jgi:hypothetical protein
VPLNIPCSTACASRQSSVELRQAADAELGQGIDLILHQRDQRRDDDGAAGAEQGGNLVAEALAAAGRHQDQGVAAAADVGDDLGLGAAEGRVAEDVAQDFSADVAGANATVGGQILSSIFKNDSFARQGLAIPDQAFAAVLVPVGEYPALDMDAVDDVVVRCRPGGCGRG